MEINHNNIIESNEKSDIENIILIYEELFRNYSDISFRNTTSKVDVENKISDIISKHNLFSTQILESVANFIDKIDLIIDINTLLNIIKIHLEELQSLVKFSI